MTYNTGFFLVIIGATLVVQFLLTPSKPAAGIYSLSLSCSFLLSMCTHSSCSPAPSRLLRGLVLWNSSPRSKPCECAEAALRVAGMCKPNSPLTLLLSTQYLFCSSPSMSVCHLYIISKHTVTTATVKPWTASSKVKRSKLLSKLKWTKNKREIEAKLSGRRVVKPAAPRQGKTRHEIVPHHV